MYNISNYGADAPHKRTPSKPVQSDLVVAVFVIPADGIAMVRGLLHWFPPSSPAVLVFSVQSSSGPKRDFVSLLRGTVRFDVVQATGNQKLSNSSIYFVDSEHHLVFAKDGSLTPGNEGETLLATLADAYGKKAIAVAAAPLDTQDVHDFSRVNERGGVTISVREKDFLVDKNRVRKISPNVDDELLDSARIGDRIHSLALERSTK